jgi:hypothetical protein
MFVTHIYIVKKAAQMNLNLSYPVSISATHRKKGLKYPPESKSLRCNAKCIHEIVAAAKKGYKPTSSKMNPNPNCIQQDNGG